MKNQFFYTRKQPVEVPQEDGSILTEQIEVIESFNMNKVTRSVMIDQNTLLILLDDLHERVQEIPNINVKTNKVVGTKKQVQVFQSEIHLTGEDITRFRNLTTIE